MAVGSGHIGCLNGEERVVQTKRLSLLLTLGEMGPTARDYNEATVTAWERTATGTPFCNGPGKIKFEGNGKNSLSASRKLLPQLEFDTRVGLKCAIHGRVCVPYLNQYNCGSTKLSVDKFTLFNLHLLSGGIRPGKVPHQQSHDPVSQCLC